MKRSTSLRLTLMTVAVPAALGACSDPPTTGTVLDSLEECRSRADLHVTLQECEAAYRSALADHQRLAPRFENAADCNEEFGNCSPYNENGHSYFIPAMGGFLLGYALGDRSDRGYYYGYGGSTPLYRTRRGDFLRASGDWVSSSKGSVRGAEGYTHAPARAVTVSRGGFGSSSAARSSFGGGRGFGS